MTTARLVASLASKMTPLLRTGVAATMAVNPQRAVLPAFLSTTAPREMRRKRMAQLPRRLHIVMSEEEKQRKLEKIDAMRAEEVPSGAVARFKFYFKRYAYILIPVHLGVCALWLGGLYVTIKSGVDVIQVLEWLRVPNAWLERLKATSPSTGPLVLALLIYKLVTPLRYASSLFAFQQLLRVLRRAGKLPNVREAEFNVRSSIEAIFKRVWGRRSAEAGAAEAGAAKDAKKGGPGDGGSSK